jgi:hypothetical protein
VTASASLQQRRMRTRAIGCARSGVRPLNPQHNLSGGKRVALQAAGEQNRAA